LLSFARNDDSDTDSDSDSDWSTTNLWSERGRESRQLRLIIWQHLRFTCRCRHHVPTRWLLREPRASPASLKTADTARGSDSSPVASRRPVTAWSRSPPDSPIEQRGANSRVTRQADRQPGPGAVRRRDRHSSATRPTGRAPRSACRPPQPTRQAPWVEEGGTHHQPRVTWSLRPPTAPPPCAPLVSHSSRLALALAPLTTPPPPPQRGASGGAAAPCRADPTQLHLSVRVRVRSKPTPNPLQKSRAFPVSARPPARPTARDDGRRHGHGPGGGAS